MLLGTQYHGQMTIVFIACQVSVNLIATNTLIEIKHAHCVHYTLENVILSSF